MSDKCVNVGILGFGIVGSGTYRLLTDNADAITQRVGAPVNVKKIADIDWERERPVKVPDELKTADADDILTDDDIHIVVETIGGIHPAADFVLKAIENGKSVVTSNKEMIARQGDVILSAAQEASVDVQFEGAVGGVIPIIRTLKESLDADRIDTILGIVNGTTNYILTRMSDDRIDFDDALTQAQELGYAEQDPTDDIEGIDAANKLAILAAIAFGRRVDVDGVYREGIEDIKTEDIVYAERLGYCIKLLAIAQRTENDRLQARVHPALVPLEHPLASVSGPFNAVFVRGAACDEVMLYGRGAGDLPTGAAVAGDVVDCARNILHGTTGRVPCVCAGQADIMPMGEIATRTYVRMKVRDQPGVLGSVATILGSQSVSISSVIQEDTDGEVADIVWVMHKCPEDRLNTALASIKALPIVDSIPARIRVLQ
ncbi:MAG: homoserine dehydrogenase [Armatimonadota bacterium]